MDKAIGFIITAGHLDIEWYQPMKSYRFWTVEALEDLKKAAQRDDFVTYVLDGQFFPLEEYLEVAPQDEEEMRKLVRDGKLAIGPFYTQFDEWLPSAESMIRNCLYGLHKSRDMGGYMRAGYLPDNFGHPRQMPQILRGFGIDSLMFMRGLPEIPGGHPDEFIYRGIDGSEVLVSHFRESYSSAFDIFNKEVDPPTPRMAPYYDEYLSFEYHKELAVHDDPRRIAQNLVANARRMRERYPSGIIPLISGFDHLPPQINIGDSVKAANDMQDEIEFIMGTAEEYVNMVNKRSVNPAVYDMELLGSRYQYVLLGALSTRTYLKRQNFACEALLERYAEPLDALASLWGYPHKPALLDEAWRNVMINSAHDSIHGSSTDEVHVEMETRFANTRQIAVGIIHDALGYMGKHCRPASKDGLLAYAPVKAAFPQAVELYLPIRDKTAAVMDAHGTALPVQIAERIPAERNGLGLPRNELFPDPVYRKVLFMDTFDGMDTHAYSVKAQPDSTGSSDLSSGDSFLENEYLRVDVDGALIHVLDKTTGKCTRNLNLLEEDADAGDAWDFSPPWVPGEIIRSANYAFSGGRSENGPVRATICMRGQWPVPACLKGDIRSVERVTIPVTFEISLLSRTPRVDVKLSFDNNAMDHRIRLRIPSGVQTDVIRSQGHLAVLDRAVDRPRATETWWQPPTQLLPCREWVAMDDGDHGLAIAFKGLYDYEAARDPRTGQPDVWFTLVRGFSYMGRVNMPQRAGQASTAHFTPGAQCPGKQVIEWAYIPYKVSCEDKAPFLPAAQAFLYPPVGHYIRSEPAPERHNCPAPPFSWEPDNIQFSAFKRRMRAEGCVLRLYENQGKATVCQIRVNGFTKAALTDMSEREEMPLPIKQGCVEVTFEAYKAVTLILKS